MYLARTLIQFHWPRQHSILVVVSDQDVITGIRPYDECGTVPAIICAMLKRLPPLEGGICAYPIRLARHIDVWSLCIGCWDYSPSVRPGCDTILWTLQRQRPYVHTACSADAAETNPGSVNPLKTMPLPSPLFTGRESIINQMTRYFSEDVEQQHIAVLHGLRGAGKSQIAYQFVYESQTNPGGSRFSEVFYVDARTASTLEHDMLSIARAKCHAEATMQDALRWLSDDKNDWLIVFDDADENFLLLNHLLLQCTHGNILITTCASALRAPIANYQVTEMELEEAKELLIRSMYPASRRLNHTTQDQIMSLVKVLRFALCIVHAGTHIANANIRIDEYLRLYAKTHSQLLEEWEGPAYKALTYSEYERIVYTTWFITLPQLSQKAKNFLRLGVCSPSGFTFESTTPADFRPSFAQSRSYCLVYYDPLNNRYSLTQPVTKWISDQLFPRNELTWRVVNPLQSVGPTWERTKQGSGAQDSLLRSVYNALGGISWGAGSNAPGALRQRVMGFPDDSFRLDHPDTLTSICQLVAICIRQKCFKVAEQLVHSLVEGFTKTVGSDDLQTLTSTSTLASIYSMQGRFREAKSLYGRVFQTRRRILGKGHDSTLTSLSDLRWTCSMLGDFRRAERWHRYGPDTRTERLGKEDPKTLDAMCHLATTLQREGKATEALAWERQLLEFEKKVEAV
ncbi:hypothetical protein SISNIDRAFT_189165 [Sistotremastrum niveocremeum HHB9708]|uniref:NB-ARC domain-containing protein n=2 Tax=Sistotremastraceae TaxID=3402574 RepID=A0A164Z4V9_9AGAM|nr:hypothetical protein SISNIDRAFT_189165 [Sistotremastrum niveocremeum HHB9708]KZT37652.1 hypothetical protein SISSUDRAFT_830540 [Sistotremastrum suecicum HHB10207 ss-3]